MKMFPVITFAATLAMSLVPIARSQSPNASPTPGSVAAFQPSAGDPLGVRQARSATRLSAEMLGGERQLLLNFRTLYAEVWHNHDGLTPQQVCDALGAKASGLFVIAGTMANAIYQIDPAGIGSMISVPPGYAATINADGTVTVTVTPAPTPTPTPVGTP